MVCIFSFTIIGYHKVVHSHDFLQFFVAFAAFCNLLVALAVFRAGMSTGWAGLAIKLLSSFFTYSYTVWYPEWPKKLIFPLKPALALIQKNIKVTMKPPISMGLRAAGQLNDFGSCTVMKTWNYSISIWIPLPNIDVSITIGNEVYCPYWSFIRRVRIFCAHNDIFSNSNAYLLRSQCRVFLNQELQR